MKELYVILLKSHVKGVILTLITTAIGVLSGIVANNITSLMWWMILISVVIVYIISVYKYAILENKQQAELNQMIANRDDNEKRVEILQSVLQGISSMNRISAKQTNLKVHEIIEQGKIYCDNWNFDIASGLVCGQIHSHAISYICKKGFNSSIIDVEVAFVCLIEGKQRKRKQQDQIRMAAFYHPSSQNPTIYHVARSIKAKDEKGRPYHDASLFLDKRNTPDILIDKEAITQKFGFLRPDHDYSQYIGIPVFCDTSDNGNKMIGLLEIACHNECYLAHDESTIKDYVNQYISPFVSQLLLLYKCDKALRAVPKLKNEINPSVKATMRKDGKEPENAEKSR